MVAVKLMASSSFAPRVAVRLLCFTMSTALVTACGSSDADKSARGDAGEGGAESPSSGNDAAGAGEQDDGKGGEDGNHAGSGAGGDHESAATGGGGGSGPGGDASSDAGASGNSTAPEIVGLHLDPEDAELDVYLGSPKSVDLDAFADYDDHSSAPAKGGTWSTSDQGRARRRGDHPLREW
jgi:hypothetical protein